MKYLDNMRVERMNGLLSLIEEYNIYDSEVLLHPNFCGGVISIKCGNKTQLLISHSGRVLKEYSLYVKLPHEEEKVFVYKNEESLLLNISRASGGLEVEHQQY